MTRKSKFRAEQIAYALKQVEAGVPMADVFRKYAAGGSCGPHLDVQSNPKPRGLEALRWTGKWGQARCGPPPQRPMCTTRGSVVFQRTAR